MFYRCPVFKNSMAIMTPKNSTVILFVYEFVFYGWWTSKHISLNKIWIICKLTVSLTFSLIFRKNERHVAQHVFGFWIISHLLFDPHKSCMELVLLQLLLQYHFSYKEVEFLYAFTTSLKTQVKLCLFWLNSMAQSWRKGDWKRTLAETLMKGKTRDSAVYNILPTFSPHRDTENL